jgi:hypothetical protein
VWAFFVNSLQWRKREREEERKRDRKRERETFSNIDGGLVYESHFAFIVFICLSHNLLEN